LNWKPAAIAALIVVLAGFGVGVLIGGKETTKTTTVVETTTVAQATPQPPQPQGGDTTETSDTGGASGDDPAVQPSLLLDEIERFATQNIYADEETHVEQIGRERYQDAVITYPFGEAGDEKATLLSPIPGTQYKKFKATVGFAAGTSSKAALTLEVRANDDRGDVLLEPIKLKGSVPREVDVPLGDAQSIVFVFQQPTCTESGDEDGCEVGYNDSSFVIGEAYFDG